MNYFRSILLFIFLGLIGISVVHAHPLDLGVLNLVGQGKRIHARLEMHPDVGTRILKINIKVLTSAALQERASDFFHLTIGESELSIDQSKCIWENHQNLKIENPQLLALDVDASCIKTQGELTLDLPFLKLLDSSYRLLSMIRINDIQHVTGADPLHARLNLSFERPAYDTGHFIWMGMEHIGVVPNQWKNKNGYHFPYGIDHILFVLALLLTGGTLFGFLKTITGFTLGHTVSLFLVTLGIIQIPGHWIEGAIALTIAFVAAEAVIGRAFKHRFQVTFGIGLIHGLGFATALSGLNLNKVELIKSVLGFNVGVELAQAIIILFFGAILIYLTKFPKTKRYITILFGTLIFSISTYWFIKRTFI